MIRMVSIAGRIGRIFAWILLGFVLGAIVFFTQGTGGSRLELWHTEVLTTDFTAQRAGEFRTFVD